MKILHVVGARPNFMKVAPIMREISGVSAETRQTLVHTGQHYDENMSRVFFDELELPHPDINLGVGSGSHAWQTAQVMIGIEPVLVDAAPDWVVVVGDVNSTLAAALVCSKLGIPVAHVEAGLRSFDRSMPEEINRQLTDRLSDLLFPHSPEACDNLRQEGIEAAKIHLVGNVMIDTLARLLPKAQARWPALQRKLELDEYVLVTLHRPSNVDDPAVLNEILGALRELAQTVQVLFPVHPRARETLGERPGSGPGAPGGLRLLDPLGYLDFLALQAHARLVLTDSGGVQEETTYLGVRCLTARPNTERPITLDQGTNRLVPSRREPLLRALQEGLEGRGAWEPGRGQQPPELWDGRAAERLVPILLASVSP